MGNRSRPIACTLSAAELGEREAAWKKLLGSGLVERSWIPGGLDLRAAPGAVEALTALIDLERACCGWIDYSSLEPGHFLLTADGDGAAVLAEMFKL